MSLVKYIKNLVKAQFELEEMFPDIVVDDMS